LKQRIIHNKCHKSIKLKRYIIVNALMTKVVFTVNIPRYCSQNDEKRIAYTLELTIYITGFFSNII